MDSGRGSHGRHREGLVLILQLKRRSGTRARLHDFLQQCPAAPGGEQMDGGRLWGSRLAGSVKNKAAMGLAKSL